VASRAAKAVCDEGRGAGDTGLSVYLDFAEAIKRQGEDTIKARYGNLFDMYRRITDENPYQVPMRIYPAVHYTMGGLWVDYDLMSNLPGLFVLGEANFSDHGANRLGASLMQGSPMATVALHRGCYLGGTTLPPVKASTRLRAASRRAGAHRPVLGSGQAPCASSTAPSAPLLGSRQHGSPEAVRYKPDSPARDEFWQDVSVPGEANNLNPGLDYAGRVADYMEFAEVLALDALERRESCGGHFREEYQTPDGEAQRNDDEYTYVAAWEFKGVGAAPALHKEPLVFEEVHPTQRSYK
jgi:succinate dehydrogenase / fumarate reductase flavoprotein subunit